MPRLGLLLLVSLVLTPTVQLCADEYRVEKISQAPTGVASKIAATLAPDGIQFIKGSSRTICRIWMCKSWAVKSAKPGPNCLYPFEPGQLIGVIQYARKGADFRDQAIAKGAYTLRYGQQPEDGAHVGTFPTRDFFLLVPATADKTVAALDTEQLDELSTEAADGGHPAMLCLQQPGKDAKAKLRHNEEDDWWIVGLDGSLKLANKTQPLRLGVVIVGIAEE